MEINFIANEIVYEVTEYNSYLVGFADDKNEPKEYVIVERALEFDEQDIKLGMDSYYFEYSDQSNSGYGLCDKVILRQNEIVFSAKHKCMDDITSITVSYNENIIEDIKEYRKMLSNIFGDILIIEQVANKQHYCLKRNAAGHYQILK